MDLNHQTSPPNKQDRAGIIYIYVVLVFAWFCFVWLVRQHSVDSISALIMTWASIALVIVPVFPKILDRIKRVKIGDYLDIELQEAVQRSTVTTSDLSSNFVMDEKGTGQQLSAILARRAALNTNEPLLLIVNLRNDTSIAQSMLFTYAFFLDIFSASVTILFVDSLNQHIDRLADIETTSIIGVSSANKILFAFYKRFPTLYRVFTDRFSNDLNNNNNIRTPSAMQIDTFRNAVQHQLLSPTDNYLDAFLSREELNAWLRNILDTKRISASLAEGDIQIIRNALEENDDYILVIDGQVLTSVITVCQLSTRLTRRILSS